MKDRNKTPNPSELINLFGADRKKFNSNEEKEYQKIEIYVYRFDFQRVAPKKEKTILNAKQSLYPMKGAEDFRGFGERSVGRLYSFDQTFVNERSKRVTSDWLVQGGKHTPGIKILGDVKA